jgi:hypothetical protein
MSRASRARRVKSGAWDRPLPRVYRDLLSAQTPEQAAFAAQLWAGTDSVICFVAAGVLWRFDGVRAKKPELWVRGSARSSTTEARNAPRCHASRSRSGASSVPGVSNRCVNIPFAAATPPTGSTARSRSGESRLKDSATSFTTAREDASGSSGDSPTSRPCRGASYRSPGTTSPTLPTTSSPASSAHWPRDVHEARQSRAWEDTTLVTRSMRRRRSTSVSGSSTESSAWAAIAS